MARLEWDNVEDRPYTAGVSRGVVYFADIPAEQWPGLVSVTEKDPSPEIYEGYYDGEKYVQTRRPDQIALSIEAYTYPSSLDHRDFATGITWRVETNKSYEIHILYDVRLTPSDFGFQTVNEGPDPLLFQWECTSTPVYSKSVRPSGHVIIVGDKSKPEILDKIEDMLYGTDLTQPQLPTIDELVDIFEDSVIFIIIDHGDGTWTAIGPDDWFEMVEPTLFKITTPSAYYLDGQTYNVSSW